MLSLRAYVQELLQNSMLNGVPQILQVNNNFRRFWKIFVLFGCLAGFGFQISMFLDIYWEYPMIIDHQMIFPEDIKLPAVTICNYNGLNRQKFCETYPEKCNTPPNITEFCETFPHICKFKQKPSDVKIPNYEYRLIEENADKELVMLLGQQQEELIVSCELFIAENITDCPTVTKSFVNFHQHVPRRCYTVNGRYDSAKSLPIIYVDNELTVLTILLNLHADDYFRPDRPVYGVVSIHSPEEVVDPFDNGIIIEEGKVYNIRPEEEITTLLPSPFNTNCSDNLDLSGGLKTLEGCIDNCMLKTYYEKCKCIKSLVIQPDPRPFCKEEDESCIDSTNVRLCNDLCPRPCHYSVYKLGVNTHEMRGFKFQERSLKDWINRQKQNDELTMLKLIIQHPAVIVNTHAAKYQVIELFSIIGGYIGIWLGMSLIALLDFLEMILMIIGYSCKKLIKKSPEVKKIVVNPKSKRNSNTNRKNLGNIQRKY